MPNYQNGKIYKLWSPEGDDIYIGSTTQSLAVRKAKHKAKKHNCCSKILFEKYDDVRIELLECCPCDNKEELTKREGHHIRNNTCVNKRIAGRTDKEYYEDNKEQIKEQKKDYREKNKEQIKEQKKDYREKNKEQIKEQKKDYRDANKEQIKEKKSIRVICECGLEVNKNSIARHRRSQRHLGNLK
jgi:hypothetical protein